MSLIPFDFRGLEIRVVTNESGEPWFVAIDVASALGYVKPENAISRHCKAQTTTPKQGGGFLTVIPERDVYRLVMKSRLPAAERFEEWVVGDVLPTIRRTGSYSSQPVAQLPQDYISALEHLLEAKKAERVALIERDHAVATKAEIGSRREATAMSTASTMTRKVKKLEAELGRNQKHATIIAVERATGRKFPKNAYVAMRTWCRDNDVHPTEVVDERYGTVKAWPAGAWKTAHGIDLRKLFAAEKRKAA